MADKSFQIDTAEDRFYILLGAAVIIVLIINFTAFDAVARFAVRDTAAFLSTSDADADLVFSNSQIGLMNDVSEFNLGANPIAAERLYCFTVTDGRVTQLRFADIIRESTITSVSGACSNRFGTIDGTVHSQPGFSEMLSEEDRNLESPLAYTCIQYDEIVTSPVGDGVYGLNCWRVSGTVEDPSFTRIRVGIR